MKRILGHRSPSHYNLYRAQISLRRRGQRFQERERGTGEGKHCPNQGPEAPRGQEGRLTTGGAGEARGSGRRWSAMQKLRPVVLEGPRSSARQGTGPGWVPSLVGFLAFPVTGNGRTGDSDVASLEFLHRLREGAGPGAGSLYGVRVGVCPGGRARGGA